MPRRPSPGNRDAIEAALSREDLAALRRICRRRRIPADAWQAIPALLEVFTTHAVLEAAARLESEGYSQTFARETAALYMGLEPEAIHARLARSRAYAAGMRDQMCFMHAENGGAGGSVDG